MSTAAVFEPPAPSPAFDAACPFPGRVIRITLPYPPSVNNCYASVRNRKILTKEGRLYKRNAASIALRAGIRPIDGPIAISIYIYRPRKAGDLDNFFKIPIDSLKGIAFEDDSQIVELCAKRFDDKANPRAELTITSSSLAGTQSALGWEGRQ